MRNSLRFVAAALLLSCSAAANAWWNADWAQRAKLTLDAGPAGADLKAGISQVPVLVRLHAGNFVFASARPDGADLRFVAADDKTPLKHHVEKWDPQSEQALVWVLVPALAPGQADAAIWLYYGNSKAPSVDDAKGVLDAQHVAVFHFGGTEGPPRDATGFGNNATKAPAQRSPASLIGNGMVFDAKEPIVVPPSASLKFSAAGGLTFSAWVKASAVDKGTLLGVRDGAKSVTLSLAAGALSATIDGGKTALKAAGGALSPDTWHHVALTAGKRLSLYVDGLEVAGSDGELPELAGEVTIGEGFAGEMDEAAISAAARPADWLRAAAKGQGIEAALVGFGEGEAGRGGSSYIGILLNAVTADGWVVIAILGVMLVISLWVMVAKTAYINRNERENHAFLDAFHGSREGFLELPAKFAISSISQVFHAGAEEIRGRINGAPAAAVSLTPKAIESIRATIDAARVREGQKLNRFMVLLTIAISGGPFLGLLGTVIGVMITFAAIAATGDVNVAAIAPGIAAALVATVAGLAVAIPALFAYNYIGTRIRNITADMQVFADEFLARVAEKYEA
jgi:biopolymer transport protein ExbB